MGRLDAYTADRELMQRPYTMYVHARQYTSMGNDMHV